MQQLRLKYWIALSLLFLFSCEKDDICVDGDTPLLIITFFDIDNTTVAKAVPALRVSSGDLGPPSTFTDRSSLDSIAIPLRVDTNTTTFSFITNSADDADAMETGNIDMLTFNYETQEVFISRACGFIANYDNLTDSLTEDDENWILDIEIVTPLVENSNAAHVQIFH